MSSPSDISSLQKKIWDGSIPLEIRLASAECRTFDQSDPYLIQCPRLSYTPNLLPRIHAFFASALINPTVRPSDGWLSYQDVPLKWHLPVGLLYDLYSGAEPAYAPGRGGDGSTGRRGLGQGRDVVRGGDTGDGGDEGGEEEEGMEEGKLPWRLVVHFTEWPDEQLVRLDGEGRILHDAFINSVKEADFLRNGTAKTVMSLSKDDSTRLWESVEKHNLPLFNTISQKLLNPPGAPLRHIPIKIYLPSKPPSSDSTGEAPAPGSLRVVQSLVTPSLPSRQPQTLGTALHDFLPKLFPSRRTPVLALPVLHGAVVPLAAGVEELMRAASYADGFLHLVVVMMG